MRQKGMPGDTKEPLTSGVERGRTTATDAGCSGDRVGLPTRVTYAALTLLGCLVGYYAASSFLWDPLGSVGLYLVVAVVTLIPAAWIGSTFRKPAKSKGWLLVGDSMLMAVLGVAMLTVPSQGLPDGFVGALVLVLAGLWLVAGTLVVGKSPR